MKKILIVILATFCSFISYAQTKTMYGFITDSITQTNIGGAAIKNLDNGYKARTNMDGRFGINAKVGDKIELNVPGYELKIINYTNFLYELDTVKIIMSPIISTLQDVVVSAYTYVDYQRDSMQRAEDFVKENGILKNTFDNNNNGPGIGISIDNLFSKREKRKRGAYRVFYDREEEEYIRFRYNPVLIKYLTGFSGQQLQHFMQSTQPSYEWLRTHTTRDDMLYYINEQMKNYKTKS